MNLAFSNSISSIVLRSISHLSGEFSWSLIQEHFFQAQKEKKENIAIHVYTSINPRRRVILLYIPHPPGISIPRAAFILERGLAWFAQVGKKHRIKFTLPRQMGRKKNRPKDKYYFFEIKYSKTSLTTTLIWWPLYKLTLNFYSLLLSQLSFFSSLESLFHQTNIRDSAVIPAQAFSVAQNVPKRRQSVNKHSFSHGTVCTNKFKYLLGDPLSWTPFLEKRAHKITEGSTFDSHWPISRINPARGACHFP